MTKPLTTTMIDEHGCTCGTPCRPEGSEPQSADVPDPRSDRPVPSVPSHAGDVAFWIRCGIEL